MALLSVRGIRKSFGGTEVLRGVDMDLEPGRVYQLIGPNGSGKTTLIDVASGALRPDAGSVRLGGRELAGGGMLAASRLGVSRTFQTPRPFPRLTAAENAAAAGRGNAGERFSRAPVPRWWRRDESRVQERAAGLLEMAGLSRAAGAAASSLSGGQSKLLELARALMGDARLVLMDEPIAGVNPTLAHGLFERIRGIAARGVAFLVIEHRLDISLRYADRVFAMDAGRIVAQGGAEEVVSDPAVVESYLGG